MTPSYQVLSGLARVFATHARPWKQLLDEAAAIIGAEVGATCLIGVRIGGSAVFDPVGVHHDERLRRAPVRTAPEFAWPVNQRAELVLTTGRPFLGGGSTDSSVRGDAESSGLWRDNQQESRRLPQMMVAIRFAGVGVGVVVIARERPGPAFTETHAQDLDGPTDVLAVALRELTIPPDEETPADAIPHVQSSNVATLNGREREVIVLLAQGLTTAEIGETMYLSARTVEWYRARIRRKLDRPTRAELVALGQSFSSSR